MDRELVTVTRAAAIAGVSPRTIRNWIQRGLVVTVRTVGGAPRIDPDSLFVDASTPSPRRPPAALEPAA